MSSYTTNDQLPTLQRRIRHIAALQIRNLTPFPARDALTQSLTQPGPSSTPLPSQPVDDIDLTVASRRRRRISAGSIATMLSLESEVDGGPGTKKQSRSASGGSFQSPRRAISGPGTPTIRPRARPSSKAPSDGLPPVSPFAENTNSDERDATPVGGHFVTHSQRALEKIISTRLVETFVTLTLQPSPGSPPPPNSPPASRPLAAVGSPRKDKDVSVKRAISASVASHRKGASTSPSTSTPATASAHLKRSQSLASSPSPASRNKTSGITRAQASSSKVANFPSPPPTPPPQSSPRRTPTPTISGTRPPVLGRKHGNDQPDGPASPLPIPFYISPLHLPSTNPSFSHLDPEREFAPWVDLSSSRVKIAIWGSSRDHPRKAAGSAKDLKGKGKEAATAHAMSRSLMDDGPPWKILEEWIVDLDDMQPLSPDVAGHHFLSNTLLLTLSSGETFHIPPVSSTLPSSPSRVPTPLGPEYNSDGEVDELRRRRSEQAASDDRRREQETLEKSLRETRVKRSASWQDLVKIVNLQTCIVDTRESLEEIVRTCDLLVEGAGDFASLRECSEREEWVRGLHDDRERVLQGSAEVEDRMEVRRKSLEVRRAALAAARAIHEQDLRECAVQAQEIGSKQQQHTTLVASLFPLRTTHIQTVSYIFPIEPLSAPDLLFTILGAPLPIPMSSDPAPPSSLPSHPEITEDTTATALGYVAQVVQHVSAYMGKGLVYPVTCCGSRSAIKDPISAMVGPRMFPLYSKGVETYRFEYGVFLLNKDIEMLMMDRNLQAMDMRHTLPNLKNLLLTLTTGECAKPIRQPISPVDRILSSGMRSPTRAISPLALDAVQLKLSSQTSVPSTGITGSRKSTPFLSPLAAILRARYPSSAGRPTVKVVDEMPEPVAEGDGGVEARPEQRSDTASDQLPVPGAETKCTVKPNGTIHKLPSVNANGSPFEKLANVDEPPTPPPLPSVI